MLSRPRLALVLSFRSQKHNLATSSDIALIPNFATCLTPQMSRSLGDIGQQSDFLLNFLILYLL